MKFLQKDRVERTVLVISDIHLGAGSHINGRRNYLEDFHYDQELVEFLQFYSTGDYLNRKVELVVNGDLFDFLAVPFVKYFDDEFWCEEASLEKLKIIVKAHPEVMDAFKNFVAGKNKNIVYIIGNHDAEFVFPKLQQFFLDLFFKKDRKKVKIRINSNEEYIPVDGVYIKHGHEYEIAHDFVPEESVAVDEEGKRYFIPPWGSYYVTRVINKFKEERYYVNAVRPIKKFIINGIIYDTLFTLRFSFANVFYFLMVRFIFIFIQKKRIEDIWKHSLKELTLWRNYEEITRDFFDKNKKVKVLIVGHTHNPIFHAYGDGKIFINTGTWTKMSYLDFGRLGVGPQLTYAQIDVKKVVGENEKISVVLNEWKGAKTYPFQEF